MRSGSLAPAPLSGDVIYASSLGIVTFSINGRAAAAGRQSLVVTILLIDRAFSLSETRRPLSCRRWRTPPPPPHLSLSRGVTALTQAARGREVAFRTGRNAVLSGPLLRSCTAVRLFLPVHVVRCTWTTIPNGVAIQGVQTRGQVPTAARISGTDKAPGSLSVLHECPPRVVRREPACMAHDDERQSCTRDGDVHAPLVCEESNAAATGPSAAAAASRGSGCAYA